MQPKHELGQTPEGDHLSMRLPWTDALAGAIRIDEVRHINLYADIVGNRDTDFLVNFPQLRGFSCFGRKGICLDGLRFTPKLKRLNLVNCLRFENMPNDAHPDLSELVIDCRYNHGKNPWALQFQRLSEAVLLGAKADFVEQLTAANPLQKLDLTQGGLRTTAVIHGLQQIRELSLWGLRSLVDIDGLSRDGALSSLEITACRKVTSLDPLLKIGTLKRVVLERTGSFTSITNSRFLRSIEFLVLQEGVTIEDGNLHPLLDAPQLKWVGYVNKRHYSIKDHEVRDRLGIELPV